MRILLLAGTGEARQLATALRQRSALSVLVSVAGGARNPRPTTAPARIGGFGGAEGFREYLMRARIDAVLDATHPFSSGISHRSAAICAEMGLPYLQFLRPAWRPGPDDRWFFAEDEAAAAQHTVDGTRVFVSTGRDRLDGFGPMPGRTVFVRRLGDKPAVPPPFEDGRWVMDPPPFTVASEIALLQRLGIDWLVVRNSGGPGSRHKIDAARHLGLQVAMIRRPPQPQAGRVDTVAGAVGWAMRLSARGAET